ncbi:hypothetical protein [Burkholderia ubonensis]|uniref:hypothetical protein n=1 Tax=Burkholderia ubonensis TaxID=101571 RepID=UPI000ADA064F|nr:hypothetical protein [Burkholderia ubonensis]
MAQFSATVKTTIGSAGKFRRMYPNVRNPPPCLSPSNMKLAHQHVTRVRVQCRAVRHAMRHASDVMTRDHALHTQREYRLIVRNNEV